MDLNEHHGSGAAQRDKWHFSANGPSALYSSTSASCMSQSTVCVCVRASFCVPYGFLFVCGRLYKPNKQRYGQLQLLKNRQQPLTSSMETRARSVPLTSRVERRRCRILPVKALDMQIASQSSHPSNIYQPHLPKSRSLSTEGHGASRCGIHHSDNKRRHTRTQTCTHNIRTMPPSVQNATL